MSADSATTDVSVTWAARLARIERTLGVSGRRLVEGSTGWAVIAGSDKRLRPLMRLSDDEARRLIAERKVTPATRGGGYVAADAEEQAEAAAHMADEEAAVRPLLLTAAGVWNRRPPLRGFASMAQAALSGDGPLTLRQASAGLRLVEDAEQAGRDPALTMNWDAGPVDRQRRGGGAPKGRRAAVAAEGRLLKVRAAFGRTEPGFRLLWDACVRQVTIRALQQRLGLTRIGATEALGAALEQLAGIYDG